MCNKNIYIENMFNSISSSYDLINNILSFGLHLKWRRKACDILLKYCKNIVNVLEVGIGTGDMSIIISKKYNLCNVLGIDISQKMLYQAHCKLNKLSLHKKIELMKCNIEKSYLSKIYFKYFDVIIFVFTIRNLVNLDHVVEECHKILKEYGYILIVEFKYSSDILYKLLCKIYSFYIYVVGSLISKNIYAYDYLNRSIQSFSTFSLEKLFLDHGFIICNSTYLFHNIVKCYIFKSIY